MWSRRAKKTVVFAAGGARGLMSLGAASALWDLIRDADEYRGTSAGALVAAALACGRHPDRVLEDLVKHPFQPRVSVLEFFASRGLDTGQGLDDMIRALLGPNPPAKIPPGLVICATCLETRTPEYFSEKTHPDLDLVTALKASCSLPIIFRPVTIGGKTYVDGAVCDPFPMVPGALVGINFIEKPRDIDTVYDIVWAVVNAQLDRTQMHAQGTVLLLDPVVEVLEFKVSPGVMRSSFEAGRQQAAAWLKKNV